MFQPITLRRHLTRTMPVVMLTAALCLLQAPALAEGDLEANFQSPPDGARPWVYWFWMNGNLTKEGMTADLEAMNELGMLPTRNWQTGQFEGWRTNGFRGSPDGGRSRGNTLAAQRIGQQGGG